MTFLQSIFLAGLAAALIPVLIHLLNRPRARVVRFSTLEFIRRLQIKKSRRIRFREILLLLLRVALIALLALAFARPALRGAAAGIGGRARTSACIVLDASYSMGYGEGDRTLFDRAKERARSAADLLQEGDEALLLLASSSPESRFERPTHNFRLLDAEIDRAVLGARGTDFSLSLLEAARALEGSRNANREIYLVSDMQRIGFADAGAAGAAIAEAGIRLFLLPVGEGARPNRAVTGAELYEPRRFGETLRIRATAINYGEEPTEGLVTLLLDGERRGTSPIRLEPGGTESVLFSVLLRGGGTHAGEIRLDDDPLPRDDAFFFTFHRPDRLEVLLVGDPSGEGTRYLRNALDPDGNEGAEGEGGMIHVQTADPSELRSIRLDRFHAVFLAGPAVRDEGVVAPLEEYVLGGGGVVIVPGDGIDVGFYNRVLLPRLAGNVRFGPVASSPGGLPAGVDRFDAEHPLFTVFRQGLDRALRDLRIYRHLRIETDAAARAVARIADGDPLLVEARRGAGRVFLWAVGADPEWSDLPTRPFFLPLVHETVRYLYSGGALHMGSLAVGRSYRKDVTGLVLGEEVLCRTPREEVALQPRSEGDRLLLEFDGTGLPGFYRIESEGFDDLFAVNPETEESDLAPLPESEWEERLGTDRFTVIPEKQRPDRPVLQARYGRELRRELLWLAFFVAVAELVLGRGLRRSAPIPRDD
ncbi:MAG: BatA domain-containing protein [Candidatus Eisenbacteria bacterium]|nr:BatA domain-containing protein [Candidatus Eisenbacteria bacterium]